VFAYKLPFPQLGADELEHVLLMEALAIRWERAIERQEALAEARADAHSEAERILAEYQAARGAA